jgi:pimeloyl-ACP methyl ester carboxylesterase
MITTIDRFVTHFSTVPANFGQPVGLFLREKLLAKTEIKYNNKVVLMVHGGFAPSLVAYDLQYKDYSFMDALANEGFDVFALSHTGYPPSPRPMMDDPHNVAKEYQKELTPHVLNREVIPRYPYKLVSSQTEWDELETVVNFICELRQVDKISFVGWSTGTPRSGGYAALHPDRVDKIVMFGIAPFFDSEDPPKIVPEEGAPTILQTRDFLLNNRWRDHVHGEFQLEDPEVCNELWKELMAADPIGASWGRDGLGIMRAPNRMNYGWKTNLAKIRAPTLMLLGEFDDYEKRIESWHALESPQKMFVKVGQASHFMQFEFARHFLYKATSSWLKDGNIENHSSGEYYTSSQGQLFKFIE